MEKYLCKRSCFVDGVAYVGGTLYSFKEEPNAHFELLAKPAEDGKVDFDKMSASELMGSAELWTKKDLVDHAKKKYQMDVPVRETKERMVEVLIKVRDNK